MTVVGFKPYVNVIVGTVGGRAPGMTIASGI